MFPTDVLTQTRLELLSEEFTLKRFGESIMARNLYIQENDHSGDDIIRIQSVTGVNDHST
jgi:hypothetical protein